MENISTMKKELVQLNDVAKNLPDEKKKKASDFIEGFITAIEFLSQNENKKNKPKLKTG